MATPRTPKQTGPGVTGDLGARIAQAQRARERGQAVAGSGGAKNLTGLSRGLRLGTEFIAANIVGAGMGFVLDAWLGTAPWLLLVMLLVGFGAGILNVVRAVTSMNEAAPPPSGSDLGPDRDDDD